MKNNTGKKRNKWIDVSMPIKLGMLRWPGDPAYQRELVRDLSRGDTANVSKLEMGAHTGTHIDAPFHFLEEGETVDKLSLDKVIGPAKVITIGNKIKITTEELKKHSIRKKDRLLFKTKNSSFYSKPEENKFRDDYVYLTLDAARYLAGKKINLVGIDYLSVGGRTKESKGRGTHRVLLSNGIWIIEGLDLSKTTSGKYDMICLPLGLEGAEASPVRALLKKR